MTKEKLKKEAEELYKDWYAHKLGAISIIDVICKMAEPREKQIEVLEKENTELKKRNAELKGMYAHSAREAGTYKQFFEKEKKENAELRNNGFTVSAMTEQQLKVALKKGEQFEKENAEVWGNLTKAKEHIRTLISCLIDWVQEGDKDYCYIADAEQFIREIEK